MWEQVKWAMVESARELCGSVRKNPKSVWWNYEVNAAVRRKEVTWKEELASSDEDAKERCMEVYRERLKGVYVRAKRKQMNSLEGR